MSRQIELTWVCSSCQHRNLGRHARCEQCDNPKDDSETYEMPASTSAAPSVNDPDLLRLAAAGPNWKCAFCGSDQRKLDGSCQQCGAPSDKSPDQMEWPAIAEKPAPILTPWRELFHWGPQQKIAAAVATVALAGGGYYLYDHRERDYSAHVESVHWKQTITVERYTEWTRDGFRGELPGSAYDVVSQGQKIHHYDQVPDGVRTETFTTQSVCGQDCTTTSSSCHEVCTNSRNGFASCSTVCSGGGQSCTPRWCSETHTQQVPQFRQEPRYAEAVKYKLWDWGDQREVSAEGSATTGMRWPTDEAKIGQGLQEHEDERERRSASYEVTVRAGDTAVTFPCPLSILPRFAVGTTHDMTIHGDVVTVDKYRVDPVKR